MLLVKLINQFLHMAEVLLRFPASPYVSITHPFHVIMELQVPPHSVEDPVACPVVTVIDYRRLRFRWRLPGGRRCRVVAQQDVEDVVLPDGIQKV
jgi:hypothetical protein